MDETQTEQAPTTEGETQTESNTGEGNKPKATGALEEARTMSKIMASQITELREIVQRQEQLAADNLLMGKSDATIEGQKPKEETDKEYRARIEKDIAEGKI